MTERERQRERDRERERRNAREREEQPRRDTTLCVTAQANKHKRSVSASSMPLECYHCSGSHAIWQWESFKRTPYKERWHTVQIKKLCVQSGIYMMTIRNVGHNVLKELGKVFTKSFENIV